MPLKPQKAICNFPADEEQTTSRRAPGTRRMPVEFESIEYIAEAQPQLTHRKMTPAEFKTLREALGLTVQWVADQAHVKLRTAQYWEGGRLAVPADVADMLERIERTVEAKVAEAVSMIVSERSTAESLPDKAPLVRYRNDADLWMFHPNMKPLPTTTHAAKLARLKRALEFRGIPAVIEFMEPDEYFGWLGKRKDTEVERSNWAASRHAVFQGES